MIEGLRWAALANTLRKEVGGKSGSLGEEVVQPDAVGQPN